MLKTKAVSFMSKMTVNKRRKRISNRQITKKLKGFGNDGFTASPELHVCDSEDSNGRHKYNF